METINFKEIPYKTAYEAYYGTSFSPERRAKSYVESYSKEIREFYNKLRAYVLKYSPGSIETFNESMQYYVDKIYEKNIAYLNSSSRIVSVMIAGPSNFPAAQMNKRNDVNMKRLNELLAYESYVEKKIKARFAPVGSKPIKTGSSDALQQLEAKLKKLEERQELMVASNKIARSKATIDEKIEKFKELGFSDDVIRKTILKPNWKGDIGFESFYLSNNSAEIRRIKGRIEQEKRLDVLAETGNKEFEFEGGKVVFNYDLNRIQIIHDQKPPKETLTALKQAGFRYSPSNGGWQRQLNTYYMPRLKSVLPELANIDFTSPQKAPEPVEDLTNESDFVPENETIDQEKYNRLTVDEATTPTIDLAAKRAKALELKYKYLKLKYAE